MIGQGALLACLDDPDVEHVLAVVRKATGRSHPKLEELSHGDFGDVGPLADRLANADACLYCLGISSARLDEASYRRVTCDFPLAAARIFADRRPGVPFVYVSGQGTDATGKGRSMWARVKGEAERGLMALLPHSYMFRPGLIEPLDGIQSGTQSYRWLYKAFALLWPLLRVVAAASVTDTRRLGRAMLRACRDGGPSRVVEVPEINRLAAP